MKARNAVIGLLLLIFAAFGSPAWAQTDEEHFSTYPFNFTNPGARPSAMGGAFMGLADDASAAVANPAGLGHLTRPQVYFEFKNLSAPTAQLTSFNSIVTGSGQYTGTKVNMPAFFSASFPTGRWVLAATYHQFMRYEVNSAYQPRRSISITSAILPSVTGANANASPEFNYRGEALSGSAALAVNDKLKVGATVSLGRMTGKVTAMRGLISGGAVGCAAAGAGVSCVPSSTMDDAAWAPGVTAGVLYEPNPKFGVGLMFSKQGSFKLEQQLIKAGGTSTPTDVTFAIPTRFGAGLAWAPVSRVKVLLDVTRVQYSEIAKNITLVVFSNMAPFQAIDPSQPAVSADGFTTKDATEIRFGTEVQVTKGRNPFFLRYGGFYLPSHNLRYSKGTRTMSTTNDAGLTSQGFTSIPYDLVDQILWATEHSAVGDCSSDSGTCVKLGKADTGFSVGGGFVMGGRVTLDAAYVWSWQRHQEVVISTAVRF
jgi:long-chain fatty acid transport protein